MLIQPIWQRETPGFLAVCCGWFLRTNQILASDQPDQLVLVIRHAEMPQTKSHKDLMRPGCRCLWPDVPTTFPVSTVDAVDLESTGSQIWLMRLNSCRLDLSETCCTELGDKIRNSSERVPSTARTEDQWI